MNGFIEFAQAVVPGSACVIASVGDEQNALLMPTVEADLGAGPATLLEGPGWRVDTRPTRGRR